jgi:hypothetical protein
MRFTALLIIAALLLKSVAGLAMAGCHAGHHSSEQAASLMLPDTSLEGSKIAATHTAATDSSADENTDTRCSLCASCCISSTAPPDTPDKVAPKFLDIIHNTDFTDLSVYLAPRTQPPKPL